MKQKIEIDGVTYIREPDPQDPRFFPFVIGEAYLIRTVTMIYTGCLVALTPTDFVLEDAAWIADTGRFADALASGSLSEVEPYPGSVIVSRAAYVDASVWRHPLPRHQK
jgi:hypothetical protein